MKYGDFRVVPCYTKCGHFVKSTEGILLHDGICPKCGYTTEVFIARFKYKKSFFLEDPIGIQILYRR